MRRASAAVGLLVAVLLGLVAEATPAEYGPYEVAEVRDTLRDDVRGRTIDILFIYPVSDGAGPAGGPFPLVVFSHGFLLDGRSYRSYGEHLASHGFVVALPTYSMNLFDMNHTVLAADVRSVIDRSLSLSEAEGHPLGGRVDPEAIGLSGHSLGGKLALLEAATDRRVGAAGLLDPVDGGAPGASDPIRYPSVAPELMSLVRIPLLLVGAGLGGEVVLFTACAPEGENYEQFFEAAAPPVVEVTQVGVGHAQYLDPGANPLAAASCPKSDVPDEWVRASSAAYLAAFFLGHLKGDGAALAWLDERLSQDVAAGSVLVRRK